MSRGTPPQIEDTHLASQYDPSDGVTQLTELMRENRFDDHFENSFDGPPAEPVDPAGRRRRRRRAWISTAVVVALVGGSVGGYVAWALNAPIGMPVAETKLPDAQPGPAAAIVLPPDGVSAMTVSGAEQYWGADGAAALFPAVGGNDPRSIASISKLITAMVVLDKKPLASPDDQGPTITFGKTDHALYDKYYVLGATIAKMPTGSTMTEHDALEMMLVISASNYAEAVSTWAFGSQEAFVSATKRWLTANGLTSTKLVEPTGIDPRNVSTPSDLLALGKLAMANPVIAQIVGMKNLEVPGHGGSNTNTLLGDGTVHGIKTGTLEAVGANLLYSASVDVGIEQPIEITGVVLGGFSRDSIDRDVVTMFQSIRDGFHDVRVGDEGDVVGTYSTPWGASARMVLASDGTVVTWSNTPITVAMETSALQTGLAGEVVGSITWTAGDHTDTVDLVLDADIEPPDDWWRLTHPGELG